MQIRSRKGMVTNKKFVELELRVNLDFKEKNSQIKMAHATLVKTKKVNFRKCPRKILLHESGQKL